MTVTTKTDFALCSCGCGHSLPSEEMFWSEDDEPFINWYHLSEAQIEAHLARYEIIEVPEYD